MTYFGGYMDEKVLREKLRAYICKELIRDAS